MTRLPSSIGNLSSTRSKLGREDIKWAELLSHFRAVQNKHEKARRVALGSEYSTPPPEALSINDLPHSTTVNGVGTNRPPARRKITGNEATAIPRPPSRALSPLNPIRSRVQGTLTSPFAAPPQTSPPAHTQALQRQQQQQQKRTTSVNRGPVR